MNYLKSTAIKSAPGIAIGLVLALSLFGAAAPLRADEKGEVIFCRGLENWSPVEPAEEFDTNEISVFFKSPVPFGVMQMTLSIYGLEEGGGQNLLHREGFDVNPEWDGWFISDLPLPETGEYLFALNRPDGTVIASGAVRVKEKKTDEPIPEAITAEGTTLEAVFNKYLGQTKQ